MKNIAANIVIIIYLGCLMQLASACPDKDARSKKMVENFLTNPKLSQERQQTGTSNVDATSLALVTNQSTCETLNQEFSSYEEEYKITYYKAGNFYFVTQILKQSDEPNRIVTGLSFIYIYNENLNFIEGYSG